MDEQTRKKVCRLQSSLSILRKAAGWSAEDLGKLLDVTRQTIVNLENGKNTMTKVQYLAIHSIFHSKEVNPEKRRELIEKLWDILVDSDELGDQELAQLKSTVNTATSKVGRRLGASAIGAAAIGALAGPLNLGILGGSLTAITAISTAMAINTTLQCDKVLDSEQSHSKNEF